MSAADDLKLSLDADGIPHAAWTGADPTGSRLATFFETELGTNPAFASTILERAAAVATGKSARWSTSGNAFAVALTPTTAEVVPLFGREADEPFSLPLADFLGLVRRWESLSDEPTGTPATTPRTAARSVPTAKPKAARSTGPKPKPRSTLKLILPPGRKLSRRPSIRKPRPASD